LNNLGEEIEYKGQFKNGVPDGIGEKKYKFINGGEFKGTFENGEIKDFGSYTYPMNDLEAEMEYKGQLRHCLPNGIGEMKYKDGSIYKGLFEEGKPNGQGEIKYIDGSSYKGIFKNGTMLDFGALTYPLNDIQGKKIYKGQFKNRELNGIGVMEYRDGSTYEGTFLIGNLHGAGKLTYTNLEDKVM
jgi:hypothetical protein